MKDDMQNNKSLVTARVVDQTIGLISEVLHPPLEGQGNRMWGFVSYCQMATN
jgi:hypothetical protein